MKTVSIVVIAHRNAYTLKRTLQSVDQYSRPHDEKILVLNNPSKEVSAIAESLSPDWTIGYESKPGPQHARNKGAAIAKNDYLAFLDDDILMTPGWIESMLSHFNSPWVAAGQSFIHFEKHDSIAWNYLRFSNLAHLSHFLKGRNHLATMDTAAVMIKKSWLNSLGGFHPEMSYVEDTELSMRIHFNGGKIFFSTNIEVIQCYDPNETVMGVFKKSLKFAPSVIKFKKLLKQPNYIEFSNITYNLKHWKKLYLRNFSFLVIDVIKHVLKEVSTTSMRHHLLPQPVIKVHVGKMKSEKTALDSKK